MFRGRREFMATASAALASSRCQARPPRRRPACGRPRAHEFVFARLRYDSGDWD
jgi:hypothetical protein